MCIQNDKTRCKSKTFANGIEIEKWDDSGRWRRIQDYKGITNIQIQCSEDQGVWKETNNKNDQHGRWVVCYIYVCCLEVNTFYYSAILVRYIYHILYYMLPTN